MTNEEKAANAKEANAQLLGSIQHGDKITILVPNGIGRNGQEWKEAVGTAVFRGPYGWVLNMGGRYGTPGIASEQNIVSVRKMKGRREQGETTA